MAKIRGGQLAEIAAAVTPLDTPENRATYRVGRFPGAGSVKDLDKRYRWDLFWAAGGTRLLGPLYDAGVNDAHLDTALRSIVSAL